MTVGGNYVGTFSIGDMLRFAVSSRTVTGTAEGTFVPTHYDVFDLETRAQVSGGSINLTIDSIANYGDDIFVPNESDLLEISTANGFEEGKSYLLIVKEGTGTSVTVYKTFNFRIDYQASIIGDTQLLFDTEVSDAAAQDSLVDNTIIGRLRTIERNQIRIIHPRLKRLLGLAGEHQLVDGYLYDDAGNISECRVRIFNNKANRDAANAWSDRPGGEADPAPSVETGEITRYIMTAQHQLSRNLRNVYEGQIEADQDDNDYDIISYGDA